MFNESKTFKHDFKTGPIILYKNKSYYEIDISNYNIDDIILLEIHSRGKYIFKYQYSRNFKGNNFIDMGFHIQQNFIPIRKKIDDSSLIIYIELYEGYFSILELIPNIEEIKSIYSKTIKGPKYIFIDYFELNNMNSIGIGSSESFFFYEQESSSEKKISKKGYQNYYITKINNYIPQDLKSIIIYINSTNDVLFEVKKFNYSIFTTDVYTSPDYEYFQLCQGENSLSELYFYTFLNSLEYTKELFTSVFGIFDSFYIKEKEIKNLTDFDFDKIKENNFYQTYNETGYLKIKCNNPLMLKHTFLNFHYNNVLNSSKRYYLKDFYIRKKTNYTFDRSLVNKTLQLRFIIFGLKQNETINLFFNNTLYTLNNTPFEHNFTYTVYNRNLFHFRIGEDIENKLLIEIIVAYLPGEINEIFKQIDFKDSLGTLKIEEQKGIIIKIPENLNKDLYDFSILFTEDNYYYVHIIYDKIEFLSMHDTSFKNEISPFIPLFKVNPYDELKKYSSNEPNKYLYILIYNPYHQNIIHIKKPMLYSDVKINKLNILPKLSDKNKNYYYQIKFPESENYNSLLIQTIKTEFPLKMSLQKNYIQYPFINYNKIYDYYYNIPFDKRDKNNHIYLNYYDVDSNTGYINFVGTNEHIYPDYHSTFELNQTIQQIEGKNILHIKMNSLSYVLYPNIIKYYIIINVKNINSLYEIITGQKTINKNNHEFMTTIEDNGLNKIFEIDMILLKILIIKILLIVYQ